MAKTQAQKLFIKPGYKIRLINSPEGFAIDGLPDDVSFATGSDK